ncbi:fluoride efflux transporter CrcB [Ahrensia sp. 13_GOM-1096m]|uniref:fluoride efflux transporter CrcB n=1 Tax=Ahrensia sp. 13_GOM-1096m TaxID=1380380 RepID=UPI00047C0C86|nr:fluoride efflux transporter CrcB [Ahrensia sp. 13_GOM-1096m]
MFSFLLIGIGGALGAMLRHGVNVSAMRVLGAGFPYGTIIVNIAGSFLMGLLIAWLARRMGGSSNELRLFLATGFLGGFTTFSAFSLDAVVLYERGDIAQAGLYIAISVIVSVGALFAGLLLMRSLG